MIDLPTDAFTVFNDLCVKEKIQIKRKVSWMKL